MRTWFHVCGSISHRYKRILALGNMLVLMSGLLMACDTVSADPGVPLSWSSQNGATSLTATPVHSTAAPPDAPNEIVNYHRSDPHPASVYSKWVPVARAAAHNVGIDTRTFLWKIMQESGFNPNAVSSTYDYGIAQWHVPPGNDPVAYLGFDPMKDPQAALAASARLDLSHLQQYEPYAKAIARRFGGSQKHFDYGMALAAYNCGPDTVSNALRWSDQSGWQDGAWTWLNAILDGSFPPYHHNSICYHYVQNILGRL